ncbi:hypothetical protein EOPP23_09040 [Endozoicomonas sp. OPT23]|uniref:hypothetical protein n=1 Tax=Endozoicomonas sp. OPT23 TaxID=2072845 RepID=UPI001890E6FC|nr:hypothetical protein [Endozoicomonas sp. OPT23]MRI33127.1 hypothetical protein [Endozoicomonas sp. OPT23]
MTQTVKEFNFKTILLLLSLLIAATPVLSKRLAPEKVASVFFENIQYQVIHMGWQNGTGQNGGYLEARDTMTGHRLWGELVYQPERDSKLEGDVQDVFIKQLSLDSGSRKLFVINERNELYSINIDNQEIKKLSGD